MLHSNISNTDAKFMYFQVQVLVGGPGDSMQVGWLEVPSEEGI